MSTIEKDLHAENLLLKEEIQEYKDLVEGIRNGGVDALAINKNGHADIFSLESSDFVYRVLVENFPEGALNVSDKGVIVYANPAFELLVGSKHTSIVGLDFLSLVERQNKWIFEKLFRDAFSGHSTGELMLEYKGKQIHVEISLSSLYPRFHGIGILIKDLSEKRKKEDQLLGYKKQLVEQEEQLLETKIIQGSIDKFRFMGDTVPQKVWTAAPSGELDYFNKKWFEYSALSADELKGRGWLRAIHPEDLEKTKRVWNSSVQTGSVYEIEHRLLNHKGAYRWHLSRAMAQHDENGDIIMWVGTTTDVHEQRNFTNELENRVNEAKVFLSSIFDSSEEVIASLDQYFNITSINTIGAKYIGLEPAALTGKSLFDLFPGLRQGAYHKLLLTVLDGKVIHQKETITIKNEEAVFDAFFKPLVIDSQVRGIVVVAKDITEVTSVTRHLEETKRQLLEQYEQIGEKNKELQASNAELVSFNYIASHDLQEPLRKILILSGRITDTATGLDESSRAHLTRLCLAARHMKNLLQALLNYSKINSDRDQFETCDFNELLDLVRDQLLVLYEDKHPVIDFSNAPTLPVIRYQIEQLFINLLSNSIKYCCKDVIPHIRITFSLKQPGELRLDTLQAKKAYWEIRIADNGIGFQQKYGEKIFGLFQRLHTDGTYDGTGIGLAICRKVAQNHSGVVLANGVPDVGSTFTVYLPEKQQALAPDNAASQVEHG